MDLPKNSFKKALKSGILQLGIWGSLPGTYAAELVGGAGYDWILFDTEHSPGDPISVLGQLQAVAPYPVAPVVRPASNDAVLIKRMLDVGAQTLLIPYVQSAQEAQAAVDAIRYPPAGLRGVAGMTRASRFGRVAGYATKAEAELCLLLQVETRAALAQLQDIAGVEGVDGIFFGPADLAASMGYPGQPSHPEVCAAIEGGIKTLAGLGVPSGILTLDQDFARTCVAAGATFVAIGVDAAVLLRGTEQLLGDFRSSL